MRAKIRLSGPWAKNEARRGSANRTGGGVTDSPANRVAGSGPSGARPLSLPGTLVRKIGRDVAGTTGDGRPAARLRAGPRGSMRRVRALRRSGPDFAPCGAAGRMTSHSPRAARARRVATRSAQVRLPVGCQRRSGRSLGGDLWRDAPEQEPGKPVGGTFRCGCADRGCRGGHRRCGGTARRRARADGPGGNVRRQALRRDASGDRQPGRRCSRRG